MVGPSGWCREGPVPVRPGAPHREPVIRSGRGGRECRIGTGSFVCVNAERAWSAVDPGFSLGPESFTIADTTGLGEGVVTYVSPEVCDDQGNCATGELEVQLDLTAPVIVLDAPPDGGSVLQEDFVAPTCVATDSLSGLDGVCSVSLSDPVPVLGGERYAATATAGDVAGNQAQVSSTFTVIVDADAPTIEATPDRPANGAGWWDGPVTFAFSCDDPGSGVASCPDPVTVSIDGA